MNTNRKRRLSYILLVVAIPILACGPLFSNRLLDGGDRAVLGAPYARFLQEIERLKVTSSTRPAVPPTNPVNHLELTDHVDLQDLTNALKRLKVETPKQEETLEAYARAKAVLRAAASGETDAGPTRNDSSERQAELKTKTVPAVPGGVPDEFRDYFEATQAWSRGDTNSAVKCWKRLMDLPPKERQFKSTWAAFMLGKAALKSNPPLAREYFQQVRALAKQGFEDTLGLASSSLGWEAKTHYDEGRLLPALELYLDQSASGDPTAVNSLRWTSSRILGLNETQLRPFALHLRARRVVTAYLLQQGSDLGSTGRAGEQALKWLKVVEAADVRDEAAAEQLALAAYRAGEVELAKRWLKIAKSTPVAEWLQSKLLLMEGRLDEAARLLARTARFFPLAPYPSASPGNSPFKESLYFEDGTGGERTAAQQLWGELGALRLARREYRESLDALLRAGFWDDAAYVAERVLTVDELKAFVDTGWPGEVDLNPRGVERIPALKEHARALTETKERLSHLLARRLVRSNRGREARTYLPESLRGSLDALLARLDFYEDKTRDAAARAGELMNAARIVRHQGLELLGTELEPDYFVHEGNFEDGIRPEDRLKASKDSSEDSDREVQNKVLFASEDEQHRTSVEPADPPQRFHYRYVAAELAWQAAEILADNSDEKARVLCEAGTWIKYLNPKAADRFYKQLVIRCGKTEIGKLADAIRWFPLMDEHGKLRDKQPPRRDLIKPTETVNPQEKPPEAIEPLPDPEPDEDPEPEPPADLEPPPPLHTPR